MIIIFAIWLVVFGLLGFYIGSTRNRELEFAAFSIALGPIGIIIALLMWPTPAEPPAPPAPPTPPKKPLPRARRRY